MQRTITTGFKALEYVEKLSVPVKFDEVKHISGTNPLSLVLSWNSVTKEEW